MRLLDIPTLVETISGGIGTTEKPLHTRSDNLSIRSSWKLERLLNRKFRR
jgi:hypothetical protein